MMCHFLSLLVLCVRVLLKSDICAIQLNICASEKKKTVKVIMKFYDMVESF